MLHSNDTAEPGNSGGYHQGMPLLIVAVFLVGLAGCASAPVNVDYPPDFSLTLLVQTPDERWVYHLHPDRDMHAATGEGVGLATNTPRTARLTIAEMTRVYDLTAAVTDAAPAGNQTLGHDILAAHLEWFGGSRTHSASYTPETVKPELSALVDFLTTLRGGTP